MNHAHVHVGKRLNRIEQLSNGKIRISFEDASCDEVDLLVGADGIRSVSERSMDTACTTCLLPPSLSDELVSRHRSFITADSACIAQ